MLGLTDMVKKLIHSLVSGTRVLSINAMQVCFSYFQNSSCGYYHHNFLLAKANS